MLEEFFICAKQMKIRNEASFFYSFIFFFLVLKYQIRKCVCRKKICLCESFESFMLMHFQSPSLGFFIYLLTHLRCHKCLHLQWDLILNVRGNFTVDFGVFLKSTFRRKDFLVFESLAAAEGN